MMRGGDLMGEVYVTLVVKGVQIMGLGSYLPLNLLAIC